MIVKTKIVLLVGAAAVTVWPFIFVAPGMESNKRLLAHEAVHIRQQRQWAIYGAGVGLLAWLFLYLMVLPVGWNPFRRKWETEAMREADGLYDHQIVKKLAKRPYFLWWG